MPEGLDDLSDCTMRCFAAGKTLADQVFASANVTSFSRINPTALGYFTYTDPQTGEEHESEFHGSGHIVGTCRTGDTPDDSVVDRDQRSWDHPILYIAVDSVFPAIATGNPSLMIAALAVWAADYILGQLDAT